jgi:cell division septum initiation protein DivIVA
VDGAARVSSALRANLARAESALLADARAEAEQTIRAAGQQAQALVAQAREEAARLVASARAEGEAEAAVEADRWLALARSDARTEILEARREQYETLRREAQAAAQSLRGTAGYERLLARLERRAREQLGAAATLERDAAAGGLVARAGKRQVDYTLVALVERCLERVSAEVERLWR